MNVLLKIACLRNMFSAQMSDRSIVGDDPIFGGHLEGRGRTRVDRRAVRVTRNNSSIHRRHPIHGHTRVRHPMEPDALDAESCALARSAGGKDEIFRPIRGRVANSPAKNLLPDTAALKPVVKSEDLDIGDLSDGSGAASAISAACMGKLGLARSIRNFFLPRENCHRHGIECTCKQKEVVLHSHVRVIAA